MRRVPACVPLALLALFLARPSHGADPAPAKPETDPPPILRLEKFIPKLDKPVYVAHDPRGRLSVVEQEGRVRLCEDGAVAKTPYLDLTDKTYVDLEGGLLSIAFHPRFADNGLLYAFDCTKVPDPAFPVRLTERGQVDPKSIVQKLQAWVAEFRADPAAKEVDVATERVVLAIDKPYLNHNGGQLQFGPDGMLYVATGDGGGADDPDGNAQNPKSLLGKVLRIDVTPRTGYGVPKDNPFVGQDGWAPEIWALGFRNPWRFSFDREAGLLYLADVGQERWEEVNVVQRGGNYGWRVREGAHDLHPVDGPPPKAIDPVHEYPHAGTASAVVGGFVYRGKRIPALRGWYLFGEYSHGRIYGLRYEKGKVVATAVLIDPSDPTRDGGQRPTQPAGFGQDAEGELYLCDINGPVYRIVSGAAR